MGDWLSEMIWSQIKHEREAKRAKELEIELQSARIRGLDYCVQCGWCCTVRPCVPTPDEVIRIADFMDMSVRELIDSYFLIDRRNFSHVYFLRPVGQNTACYTGDFLPAWESYNEGRCIFLDQQSRCKIYTVRPRDAVLMKCWDASRHDGYNPLVAWEDDQLKKQFGIDGKELEF